MSAVRCGLSLAMSTVAAALSWRVPRSQAKGASSARADYWFTRGPTKPHYAPASDGVKRRSTQPALISRIQSDSLCAMDDPALAGTAASADEAQRDRLDSWKQIAAYLGRGVTTVQRWEQEEGLPVHRLLHAKKGSVFAFKSELDAWQMSRAPLSGRVIQAAANADAAPVALQLRAAKPWSGQRLLLAVGGLAGGVFIVVTAIWGFSAAAKRDDSNLTMVLTPRPLANDHAGETTPSFSPDGSRVVYHWAKEGAEGLYIKPLSGQSAARLTIVGSHSPRFPRWSPRGDLIAFLSLEHDGRRGVYIVSPAGGTPRRLGSAAGIGLCWTPEGTSVGYVDRNSDGEPLSIFTVSIETGLKSRKTMPPRGSFGDTDCSFSTDGRLAVSRFSTRYQSDICLIQGVDANETVTQLTHGSEGITGLGWTPDGDGVVFGTAAGLWQVSASQSAYQSARLIARAGGSIAYPTFSRSSSTGTARLAYEVNNQDVNLWRWDGGASSIDMKKLDGSTVWEDHPALSPAGDRLAFVSNRSGEPEIWIGRADGSQARQVTFHKGPPAVSPRWSPDGHRLAYVTTVGGNQDIYVTRMDGTQAARLTWEASQEENPSWSRDGRWIYFRSDRTGVGRVWKTASDGSGFAVPVTTGEASQAFDSPDGALLYFTRRWDALGLWSVPVGGGPETLILSDVEESFWGVTDRGVAYIVRSPERSPGGPSLRHLDLASGQVSVLAMLPARPTQVLAGFSISRDTHSAIWTRLDKTDRDLMLVEAWPSTR